MLVLSVSTLSASEPRGDDWAAISLTSHDPIHLVLPQKLFWGSPRHLPFFYIHNQGYRSDLVPEARPFSARLMSLDAFEDYMENRDPNATE